MTLLSMPRPLRASARGLSSLMRLGNIREKTRYGHDTHLSSSPGDPLGKAHLMLVTHIELLGRLGASAACHPLTLTLRLRIAAAGNVV